MNHRILFTVENLFPFGPARSLLPLARQLKAAGCDVVIAVLGQRDFNPQRWINAGLRVFFVNGDDATPLHTARDALYVVRELRSLLRLVEPDLIHAWCGDAIGLTLTSTQPFPGFAIPQVPMVATELEVPHERRFVRTQLEAWMARKLKRLIVPHEIIANRFVEEGFEGFEIDILPNPPVVSDFETDHKIAMKDRGALTRKDLRERVRKELGIAEEAHLAVAIADLEPRNRLKDLIWATDLLVCVREDFHFAIIGSGSQRRRLRRFAYQTEAAPHVHFVGRPNQPDSILAAADVYWQSHLHLPMSTNLMSAMAMGIPVIGALGAGSDELIRHQETGFAVNYGARDEFARWTKFLIEQSDAGARLARQGQAMVKRKYSVEQTVDGYRAIYGEVLGG